MKQNKLRLFVLIAAIVLILDQLTKYLISKADAGFDVSSFLSIRYTTNTGAAFSILQGRQIGLILFSVIVLGAIIYYFKRIPQKMHPFAAMVFGGALGNLIDRVIRGHVVDFIDFSFWPSFNVADMGVTLGVIGLVWMIWKD